MGVFTTQTLLNSVGASRNSSASAAVAINWILKVFLSRISFHASCMYNNPLKHGLLTHC
jgi:hypothetical protein